MDNSKQILKREKFRHFSLSHLLLERGRSRLVCAVTGVAIACAAAVFTFSLSATNSAQAPALAKRAAAPWAAWKFTQDRSIANAKNETSDRPLNKAERAPVNTGKRPQRSGGTFVNEGKRPKKSDAALNDCDVSLRIVSCTIDYRPGGRVLQGPPMRAVIAAAPCDNPYASAKLAEGTWVNEASEENEVVCTYNAMKRFSRGTPPPLGTIVKFVGMHGTMSAKIVGYLSELKLPAGWPNFFANKHAFDSLSKEMHGTLSLWKKMPESTEVLTPDSDMVKASFAGDENKRMDYAKPLLFLAAILTALSLLVNSLLISVESNRQKLSTLRTLGMTRGGVLKLVTTESLFMTFVGFIVGIVPAVVALHVYVAADNAAFPTGAVIAWKSVVACAAAALVVALVAVLFAMRAALSVKPLEEMARKKCTKRVSGMAIAFACGFGAFVAVVVWGASLMRGFVPSVEWPDAIVSVLPEGVSSFEIEKLRNINGVERISELVPLQLNFDPEEEMKFPGGKNGSAPQGMGMMRKNYRNALFLAAEWLPKFRFVEGDWESCEKAVFEGDACVISEMISRARNLHKGDKLRIVLPGRGEKQTAELPIAGVVDVNWHMVTSRGLVRGLNRAPVMTDGPVFVSFDTIESLSAMPSAMAKMTHLWVEYKKDFLAAKGVFPAGREVEAEIAKILATDHSTVRLHSRDEIADGTLAHGSDLIGQAARVPFVFLAILALGFIAMLVADADAEKRNFAILRAVGATRAQLSVRLVKRAIKVAFYGMIFGFPAGCLVGWLAAIKTAGIWPGMPHYFEVPYLVMAKAAAGAMVFVLIVSVPTAMTLINKHIKR